jgi:sphinganine-1-phosphate aldolase
MAAASMRTLVSGRWDLLDAFLYGTDERLVLAKNVVVVVVAARVLVRALAALYDRGLVGLVRLTAGDVVRRFFRAVKKIPYVRRRIDDELRKITVKMEHDVAPALEGVPTFVALPSKGLSAAEVNRHLDVLEGFTLKAVDAGKVSGTVYHGGEDLTRLTSGAYARFALSNPLHPDVFPGVRKMEAEVVAMVVAMFHGGPDACGTTTSGGTESILMACKAMREWARDVKGITEPEMVIPVSAHAAFDKAGHYFGIRIFHAPVEETSRRVDVRAMRRLITRNTIMVRASAAPRVRAVMP